MLRKIATTSGLAIAERAASRTTKPIRLRALEHRQLCTYAPVLAPADVKVGDAVFCHVGRNYFTHLIKGIDGDLYIIANITGFVNGKIPIGQIFGKVVNIED